jgi:choline dehydrogenase-like flavoprotein
VHGTSNLYVTDGSFMPNGGSVTPTLTIYANSFRVADKILESFS